VYLLSVYFVTTERAGRIYRAVNSHKAAPLIYSDLMRPWTVLTIPADTDYNRMFCNRPDY